MQAAIRKKWLAALRGEDGTYYKQAKHQLRENASLSLVPTRHCCLGVLCDIFDPEGWRGCTTVYEYDYSTSTHYPPAGLRTKLNLSYSDCCTLTELNDEKNYSFKKIADWIEQNIPADP